VKGVALTREEIIHMMWTRIQRLVAVGLVTISVMSVGLSGVAQAIPVTFSFQGVVPGGGGGFLNPPILPNTPISGSYTFESTTSDLLPGDPSLGRYALSSLSINLLGGTYSMDSIGRRDIDVRNFGVGLNDSYTVLSESLIGPPINGLSPLRFSLFIGGISAFTDDSLPLTPPLLSNLIGFNSITMHFTNSTLTTNFSGRLTDLAAVPEPNVLMLTGTGLLGLIGAQFVRRRMVGAYQAR